MDLSKTYELKGTAESLGNLLDMQLSACTETSMNYHCTNNIFNEIEAERNYCLLELQKTEKIAHLKDTPLQPGCRLEYGHLGSKDAMDLTLHIQNCRTIFDDAEYFALNHPYKLMPITFEAVNETIIHIEHNYCSWSSEIDTQTISLNGEIEERNYKERKSKVSINDADNDINYDENEEPFFSEHDAYSENAVQEEKLVPGKNCKSIIPNFDSIVANHPVVIQPLDLSLTPSQQQKTENMFKGSHLYKPKAKSDIKSDLGVEKFTLNESNKENVTSSKKLEVTISRPGQKEFYEPCEIFVNDVARISPDLIRNDCHEINIIDQTRSQNFQKEKCRTYYIVSEATWRTFKSSTERIILTNDLNIGQPITNNEKLGKPTYIIFDQCSLTESLAELCHKRGGSFEYTCLEESKELIPKVQDNRREVNVKGCDSSGLPNEFAVDKVTLDLKKRYAHIESWTCNNEKCDEWKESVKSVMSTDKQMNVIDRTRADFLQRLCPDMVHRSDNELVALAENIINLGNSGSLTGETCSSKEVKSEDASENKKWNNGVSNGSVEKTYGSLNKFTADLNDCCDGENQPNLEKPKILSLEMTNEKQAHVHDDENILKNSNVKEKNEIEKKCFRNKQSQNKTGEKKNLRNANDNNNDGVVIQDFILQKTCKAKGIVKEGESTVMEENGKKSLNSRKNSRIKTIASTVKNISGRKDQALKRITRSGQAPLLSEIKVAGQSGKKQISYKTSKVFFKRDVKFGDETETTSKLASNGRIIRTRSSTAHNKVLIEETTAVPNVKDLRKKLAENVDSQNSSKPVKRKKIEPPLSDMYQTRSTRESKSFPGTTLHVSDRNTSNEGICPPKRNRTDAKKVSLKHSAKTMRTKRGASRSNVRKIEKFAKAKSNVSNVIRSKKFTNSKSSRSTRSSTPVFTRSKRHELRATLLREKARKRVNTKQLGKPSTS